MSQLQLRELTPGFGAEIAGVDLDGPLDPDTVRFLRRAFDDRGLLVFRDAGVDRPYQYYLSTLLGGNEPPSKEESEAGAARQGGFWISNKEPDAAAPFGRLLFHCDGMWSDEPFEVLSLYAVDVQPPIIPTAAAAVSTSSAGRRIVRSAPNAARICERPAPSETAGDAYELGSCLAQPRCSSCSSQRAEWRSGWMFSGSTWNRSNQRGCFCAKQRPATPAHLQCVNCWSAMATRSSPPPSASRSHSF